MQQQGDAAGHNGVFVPMKPDFSISIVVLIDALCG